VINEASENLGEVISGEKIETSPYEVFMRKTEACKVRRAYVPLYTLITLFLRCFSLLFALFLLC
jgi:hypothetical protein